MNKAILILALCLPLHSQVTNLCQVDPSVADATPYLQYCLTYYKTGIIYIPGATYTVAGTLTKTRDQSIVGAGSSATVLKCTNPNAPCIVSADTTYGPNNYQLSRIQDLTLQGNGVTPIGVYLGGDPAGVISPAASYGENTDLVNMRITGFNYGVQYGNNTWSDRILHSLIFGNTAGLYVPSVPSNSGENMNITDSSIFNNTYGIEDAGAFEWMISGTAFDYNGTAVYFLGSTIHVVNCHFEQPTAQIFFQPYGSASLSIKDSELLAQNTAGSDPYLLSLWPQSDTISIDNVSVWSNHAVQYFMRVQGSMSGVITNLYGNGNSKIGNLFSTADPSIIVTASVLK